MTSEKDFDRIIANWAEIDALKGELAATVKELDACSADMEMYGTQLLQARTRIASLESELANTLAADENTMSMMGERISRLEKLESAWHHLMMLTTKDEVWAFVTSDAAAALPRGEWEE